MWDDVDGALLLHLFDQRISLHQSPDEAQLQSALRVFLRELA
jgi:hypothetical protein